MSVRKFHINPKTGDVGRCFAQGDTCPFGSVLTHFYDENSAWRASEIKLKEFHEWTAQSRIPQDPNWFTVNVLYPNENKIFSAFSLAKPGHHLLLEFEDGWIYEKVDTELWKNIKGTPGERFSPRPEIEGEIYHTVDLDARVFANGARIESTEGLPYYEINWPGTKFNSIRG